MSIQHCVLRATTLPPGRQTFKTTASRVACVLENTYGQINIAMSLQVSKRVRFEDAKWAASFGSFSQSGLVAHFQPLAIV